MSTGSVTYPPALSKTASAPLPITDHQRLSLQDELEKWLGQPFAIRDAVSGGIMESQAEVAVKIPPGDDLFLASITPVIYKKGQATIVAEDAGCCFMAIPLAGADQVAISPFRISSDPPGPKAADFLGVTESEAKAWLWGKPVWDCSALERMAAILAEKMATDVENRRLAAELARTSARLTATYQEVSLLYGLIQNLRISSGTQELGELALRWLSEVIPCQGLAIRFLPPSPLETDQAPSEEAKLLQVGNLSLDLAQLDELVNHFGKTERQTTCVANTRTTSQQDWPYPQIRHLAAIPLMEGENLFGWLFAINHDQPDGFGTVETSLLTSVGAILGIHSANFAHYRQQSDFLTSVVQAFTSAIDAKDPYTCGHSDRVARMSVCLAKHLGLDTDELNLLYMSGLLHDVGKIGIDDDVLRKPGQLTDEEFEQIKLHPELGCDILKDLKPLVPVLPVVRHHHERWDGKGYPYGLKGLEIPQLARIAAVADAFDAMSSDRPYRRGMPDEKVDAIFRDGSGTQWDPQVIEAFFATRDQLRELIRQERANLPFDVRVWLK